MAEERGPMRPPPTDPAYAARNKNPEEIADDIRHTRAEMSETIDAISARFEPQYLKEQVKDTVRETARDARTSMIDTIRENPVPTLIAGLSVGWLLFGGGRSSDRRSGYDRAYEQRRYGRGYRAGYGPDYARYGAQEYGRGYDAYATGAYAGGQYDESADADGHSLRDRAGDVAEGARERAHHLADEASDRAHEWADDARRYGRRTSNWLSDQLDANPLAVGAVALAAGALVGLAVPETDAENELMGEAADKVKRQARDVAEEKLDQAKQVAEATAEEAKEKAGEVASKAREEADKKGLTDKPDALSGFAGTGPSRGSAQGFGSETSRESTLGPAGSGKV